MQARVLPGEIKSFNVKMGVKQGCVMALVLFNIFPFTVARLLHNILGAHVGIGVRYCFDGALFNSRRLQANSKTLATILLEFHYADECALLVHDPLTMQQALNIIAKVYSFHCLKVIAGKTEIMAQYIELPSEPYRFYIFEEVIEAVTNFRYVRKIL